MKEQKTKLEFINVTKTFLSGKIIANNRVNLKIGKGTVHALVGENGSGKSTLMSILFGLYNQDSGEIKINNQKVNMFQQGASKKHKIGMVHQHFHLIDKFTVIENIILGQESIKVNDVELKKINNKIDSYTIEIKELIKDNPELIKINDKYLHLKGEIENLRNEKKRIKNETSFNDLSSKVDKLRDKLNKESEKKKTNENKINLIINERNEIIQEIENIVQNKLDPLDDRKTLFKKEIEKLIDENKDLDKLVKIETKKENLIKDLKTRKTSSFAILNKNKMNERFEYITKKYGIKLKPNKKVSALTVGERQKVEILKTLWEEKEVIVFDEPTATLSVKEIDSLMELIDNLKNSGVTILFISHKLKEVKKIADKISVLKKGVLVETFPNDENATIENIATKMVGETIKLEYEPRKISEEVNLEVKGLSYITHKGFKAVDNVSFEIKKDEIFGLAGIEGNGQEEVLNMIAGLKKPTKDSKIIWKGEDITETKIIDRSQFTSHIPIDRFKHGIIPNLDLSFNSIITTFNSEQFSKIYIKKFNRKKGVVQGRNFIVDHSSINDWTKQLVKKLDVQGASDVKVPIRNLSGGNQQKFIIAREIERKHKLLLAGHPTRGLDIKAIDNIYKTIIKNSKGKSTLLYSLEINELLAVCDRIAIMYKGKIVDIIKPSDYTLEQVSKMLVGEK